jgi:hypothetical protein
MLVVAFLLGYPGKMKQCIPCKQGVRIGLDEGIELGME